ncbi:PrgI family protein [Candidatus Saccharibacteria bacterium]|nr:PrgI family protein [Candidatus Saccharibacteria bacterium]
MAQYKVPQDVEADDKLLGPFSFRQFIYLLIAGGLIFLAVGLFQLFPLLAIIPLPFVLLLAVLALPLKKDQPMETYLAAIVSYYLKPHNRVWTPGQRESTIMITAPKKVEETRTRSITGEEATHRLSFLADIVDTEGYAIKGMGPNRVKNELVEEADATADMFETSHFDNLENTIAKDENERHQEVIKEMREQIEQNSIGGAARIEKKEEKPIVETPVVEDMAIDEKPDYSSPAVITPVITPVLKPVEKLKAVSENATKKEATTSAKPSIIELANNPDFSVATIEKEANRINGKEKGEVFISLH